MKNYNSTMMMMSLKYCKEVVLKYGKVQENGTYILDNRVYEFKDNSVNSYPLDVVINK